MATIKNLKRMCKFYKSKCSDCPLWGKCCAHEIPDNADEIVNDWVREHPARTYVQDFFSKFPNAEHRQEINIPKPCLREIYGKFSSVCNGMGCYACWNQEMMGDEQNDIERKTK